MNIIKLFIFTAMLSIFYPSTAWADGFIINLYYNTVTKTLEFNKKVNKSVVRDQEAPTSIVEFSKDETVGPYLLKLYDAKGVEFSTNQFDKKDGAFQLSIPYFSIASQLKIFNKSTNKELLSVNLGEYNTCNGNGKCEASIGETNKNCMGDCTVSTTNQASSQETNYPSSKSSEDLEKRASDGIVIKKTMWQKISLFFENLF